MKKTAVIVLILSLLCSCGKEVAGPVTPMGYLALEELCTKAIDADLTVQIQDRDGNALEGMTFTSATAPSLIELAPGLYNLYVFNVEGDWRALGDGRGTAVYSCTEPFSIQAEWTTYINLTVPFDNYAVRFKGQDGFSDWFPQSHLTIREGSRSVGLDQDYLAFFDATSLEFSLSLTNADGDSYSTDFRTLDKLEKGHLYTIIFSVTPSSDGGADIDIRIDDEFDDVSDPDDDIIIG